MTAELVIMLAVLIIGLSLSAIAINYMRRMSQNEDSGYESREEKLEKELDKLRKALQVVNEDRVRDSEEREKYKKQIQDLNAKLEEAYRRIFQLETRLSKYESVNGIDTPKAKQDELLVVISSDPDLKIDLATLRGVKRVTGMRFTRLLNATLENLHRSLSEKRLRGNPYKRVLFSVHANKYGIELDKMISPEQLSAELQDVELVIIAGCESSDIGQWLHVVPYVITLREKVPMEDASRFIDAYFTALGNMDYEDSFYEAIDKVPTVGEYAEIHV